MSELSHYRYIDALRGIAFLGVLTCHVGLLLKPTFPGYDVFMMGARGVQLFYLLSAATLLRSFSLRGAQERFPIRNFFVRRLFRIAPLFWFAMALYYWQMGARPRYWAPNGLQTWHFVTTALFLNGWTLTSINSVVLNGWSVAIEMTFYLMLPFLAKRITTIWGGITATLCATSIAIILDRALMPILTQTTPQNEQVLIPFFIYSWFPSQLPVFLLGFVLYSCLQNETVMKMLAGSERPAWLVIAAVVGCLGLASVPKEAGWEIPLHVYDAIALMFLVLAVHIRPFAWIVNLFTCRIGVISYGCYLFHAAGLTVVGKCVKIESFGSLAPFHLCTAGFILTTWVAGLMVTIAMAAAGYLLIERPGIRLGNRIIGLWENPHPVISRSTVTRLTTD